MKRKFFNSFITLLAFCFIFTTLNPGQISAQTIDQVTSQTQQSIEKLILEDSTLPSNKEEILEDNHLEEIDIEAEDYVGPTDEINSDIQPYVLHAIPAVIKGFKIGAKWYAKKYDKNYTSTGKTTNVALRNGHLSGSIHTVTKIAFKEGFPVFNPVATVNLPFSLLKSANATQFSNANKQLAAELLRNPYLVKKFTQQQIKQINNGNTPDGYIWHHHQNPGVLQLVDKYEHEKTGHTGGKSLWGS